VIAIAAGLLLFAAPALVLSGLVRLVAGLIIADGGWRLAQAIRERGAERAWSLFNAALNIVLGVLLWRYGPAFGAIAVALVLGVRMISAGWRMLLARADSGRAGEAWVPDDRHPDPRLGLPPHPEIGRLTRAVLEQEHQRWRIDLVWVVTLAVVFFLTHAGRMDLPWNVFGIASTAVAVIGDLVTAILLTVVVLLPARLLVRTLTRFLERSAWQRRLVSGALRTPFTPGDRLVDLWLDGRLRFAVRLRQVRESFAGAVWRTLQDGLPLTAILIAVNPIWGFSWYFNSENWVSGVWQRITATRVDVWRERMVDAVTAQMRAGVLPEALFAVAPPGVSGQAGFSFLVVGDPGEGDPSQQALRDRILMEGRRADVKFLVVASDVIYPAGAMRDYEGKFYLMFKGFAKPIYAIPGNHDWFDALEGFTANFLEPDAARAALRARREGDRLSGFAGGAPVEDFVAEAARLRREYEVQAGLQRAPFFELHADRFTLIAADTGIRRRLDARQRTWLEAALERSRGKFTMVLLGHPLFAGGYAQAPGDPQFDEIHHLLRRYEVPLVMAGDTHDFEYYRERYGGREGSAVMHHVVNGGGGAYLSVGTALDWPPQPPVADWAFYPSSAAMMAKLDRETAAWKRPLWWWVKYLGAWPSSAETLSGMFDFNRAPFFQSFAEVRVEGSADRVRVLMHGVHGPLRWRDLERGGQVVPEGRSLDDPVDFVVPLPPSRAGGRGR
jgi:3',5'-cyclic AMP phosphodiesterase CpdA